MTLTDIKKTVLEALEKMEAYTASVDKHEAEVKERATGVETDEKKLVEARKDLEIEAKKVSEITDVVSLRDGVGRIS